jgi:hypothetical protein
MAVTINIDLNRKFIVNGDINTIFSFLSDIPASAEHFPKVHALTALAIKGKGNSIVSGRLKLTELASGTHVSLKTKAALTLPLPRLLKLAISPMVKLEFSGMVDTYLRNLTNLLVHSELKQTSED